MKLNKLDEDNLKNYWYKSNEERNKIKQNLQQRDLNSEYNQEVARRYKNLNK
jgi:hypothetical protein